MNSITPVMLIILDGWGVGAQDNNNAIFMADTPNMDRWQAKYPYTSLQAHNGAVGLPEGQMGNSEVGHLNIGAGRVVYQDFTRINKAVNDGSLSTNETLNNLIELTKSKNTALHLLGLLSDGGVHSHIDHLIALVRIASRKGLKKIFIHCFMDGRDTPPKSGADYIGQLQDSLNEIGTGKIASISGRYYAMDRDNRWDRIEKAWHALVDGKGRNAADPQKAVQEAYLAGETDEFIKPVNIFADGEPLATIKDGDSVLFFNFRADRARQLTHAFTDPDFNKFACERRPLLTEYVTCTRYEKTFTMPVLFPPHQLNRILGEEISRNNLSQLRIAETEKYAHVTYFFNGGREQLFENEDRILIESPRDIATYDLKPEMSAYKVTEALLNKLEEKHYDLIVLNYANGDMVGHTGIMAAAIKACETVDECLGKLVEPFVLKGGIVMITADHGNADYMEDQVTHSPYTAHTLNPVPFILISEKHKNNKLKEGGALKDIAPTVLSLMGLKIPVEMEGKNLILQD